MNKICFNCQWWEPFASVCCNWESKDCADVILADNTCPHWENYESEMWGDDDEVSEYDR